MSKHVNPSHELDQESETSMDSRVTEKKLTSMSQMTFAPQDSCAKENDELASKKSKPHKSAAPFQEKTYEYHNKATVRPSSYVGSQIVTLP
jgi:hypothetical protein